MSYKKLINLTLTIATLTTINTIIPQIKTPSQPTANINKQQHKQKPEIYITKG